MATQGTPNEGLDLIGDRVYVSGSDLTLVAYTNTADSLGAGSVYANLTQPSVSNGYAPILLDGTWVTANGILGYTHSSTLVAANPLLTGWAATGVWSATVIGVAILDGTSTLLHFKDLSSSFTATDGKKLGVDLQTVVA